MTNGGGRAYRSVPSDVLPRMEYLIKQRYEQIDLYEEQIEAAGRADANYDAAKETIKMRKRLLDGVKTNAEAETWAKVDPEVVELDTQRQVTAGLAKATLLRIDNLDTEIRMLHSLLVKERDTDRFSAQFGEG
ncbi:hypothetical protein SEA_GINGERBUG_52 [Microbacterium phage Gingerbug]|nr:hypothetical protein SEA_GINGERBUG_52 [Microbacterium phage Gingerbug]